MARARNPNRDKAYQIWFENNGDITNRKIAEILSENEKSIGAWKSLDKWSLNRIDLSTKKNEFSTKKNDLSTKKKTTTRKPSKTVEVDTGELTKNQRLFCVYYVKTFNATQAAIKAGYAAESAHVEGSRLLRNAKVAEEIKRLKSNMTNALFVDAMDVLNKYVAIAFADIKDYVEFGQLKVPILTKKGPVLGPDGEVMMTLQSFVAFRDADQVDGAIISEVKEGRDGISVKLHDKMKALEVLTKYFDLLPDNHRRMVEEEKLKMDRERLELDKAKASGDGDQDEGLIDDWVDAVIGDESG